MNETPLVRKIFHDWRKCSQNLCVKGIICYRCFLCSKEIIIKALSYREINYFVFFIIKRQGRCPFIIGQGFSSFCSSVIGNKILAQLAIKLITFSCKVDTDDPVGRYLPLSSFFRSDSFCDNFWLRRMEKLNGSNDMVRSYNNRWKL